MARVPSKVIVYGLSGVGKSTLASTFDKPIFFDLENGLRFMPGVAKVRATTYEDFVNKMTMFMRSEKKYDTVVIDSVDWLMSMLAEDVSGSGGKTFQEGYKNANKTLGDANGGYGKGYEALANQTKVLLHLFDKIVDNGYTVVLIAHAVKKDIMDADGISIEQVAPKIDKRNMDLFVEWADHILYLKDVNGARSLQLSPDGVSLAKNRLGLNGSINLDDKFNIEKLLEVKE